jgi:hypothetical protein
MFKSLGLLIYKTSWWRLLLGGVVILLSLVMFTFPDKAQTERLTEQASTPEEKLAIEEEVMQANIDEAGQMVMGMASVWQFGALTPGGRQEWESTQRNIEQQLGQQRISEGQSDKFSWHDTIRNARLMSINAASEGAQREIKAAQESRQKIEAARDEALQRLREKGEDLAATERSFDPQLQDAKRKEVAAQAALDGLAKARAQAEGPAPAPSPELKNSIHAAAAQYHRRMGATVALGIAYVLLFLVLLAVKFLIGRSQRALLDLAAAKDEEAKAIDLRRQMTEARLQMLQAQVEPHYLYNTLANVQALTEVDPPAASKLVGNLIDYLRAALPKMRESTSTVGQEVERVRAYLNILKIRMGDRLAFEIQVHDDLLKLPMPPMMLPTLVENAIKHGLEPKREGGRIDVWVTRERRDGQDRLLLLVRDTGMGLSEQEVQSGSGVGLSNLHERLSALYGDTARFTLESNEPCGAVATLDVPLQPSSALTTGVVAPHEHGSAAQTAQHGERAITGKKLGAWSILWRIYVLVLLPGIPYGWLMGWFTLLIHLVPTKYGLGALPLNALYGPIALMVLPPVICLLVLAARRFGMGSMLGVLLLAIPAASLISMFPVLSLLIPIGLVIYWIARKKRRNSPDNRQRTNGI